MSHQSNPYNKAMGMSSPFPPERQEKCRMKRRHGKGSGWGRKGKQWGAGAVAVLYDQVGREDPWIKCAWADPESAEEGRPCPRWQ